MVRGRPGGCGQVPAEEAPQRRRNVQDVMMIKDLQRQQLDLQRQIDVFAQRLELRDLQRQVAKLTQRLAAQNFKDREVFDRYSQPAFETHYNGDSGGRSERYGGASLKNDLSNHSVTVQPDEFFNSFQNVDELVGEKFEDDSYEEIFYEGNSSSSDCEVDWTKPPIYDDYGEEEEEDLTMDDCEQTLHNPIPYKVILDSSQLICQEKVIKEDEDDDVQIRLEESAFPFKLPSYYCDPFLVERLDQVPMLNSRASSFEEGVTDAGGILEKYLPVSEKLFRSKRRIRGRIEGCRIWTKSYIILSGNGILKRTRDLSRAPH